MSQLKLTADSGGGTVAIKGPASTTGNAAIELTVPGTGSATLLTSATSTGKILQVVKTDTTSTTSIDTFVDVSGMSVSITPSSTSSKILVTVDMRVSTFTNRNGAIRLVRGSTPIYIGDSAGSRVQVTNAIRLTDDAKGEMHTESATFLDSPSTTSATTYKVQWCQTYGGSSDGFYLNRSQQDTDNNDRARAASSITVMEVAG